MNRGRLAQRGALFVCVSKFIRERVLALGFPENRTVLHYIGVDTSSPPSSSSRSVRPVVLHVARLVEKKGTGDLIAAFARVLRTISDANLVIVGDGPQEAVLRAQVRALNIERSVAFLGSKPHSSVLDLMSSAWVFCLPSVTAKSGDSEGLAIVLLEAGAHGVPVVATRHGGIPEAVEHEKSGLLHQEHDVEGLASSLEHLLRNEKARLEMGRNARAHVVKNFSLLKQSTALAGIYESIR
jgi:glycosyltransferase involved in cell wall biosynthesis